MNKFTITLIIIGLFTGFYIYTHHKKSTSTVLNVINATTFQIDLNSNGVFDDGETVCVPNIKTFSLDLFEQELSKAKGISFEDAIAMGYLTEEYSKNLLFLTPVKVKLQKHKTHDCQYGEIFIEDENYSDKLYNQGYALKNGRFNDEAYNKKLEQAKKLKLVILNLKSSKYHTLRCEYGLQSSDYVIIPKNQLFKGTKPCNFCSLKKKTKIIQTKSIDTLTEQDNIKLVLTDYVTNLKPNRNCEIEPCISLLKAINNAQVSIDMALYGWEDIPKLTEAIKNAQIRGVMVRVVYDETSSDENYYSETSKLIDLSDVATSDRNLFSNTTSNKLMHNKFIIFDNETVMTGSMNYSEKGLSAYNADAVVFINSKEIAELYTAEFEQMLSGKFHNEKSSTGLNNTFEINNTKIKVYFSPYDKIVQKIIPIIDSAQSYIYVPAFIITHEEFANALLRAKKRNLDVKIILDATSVSNKASKHKHLRNNGINLKTENYAGKLHSKSLIIDNKFIIVGSMNFSQNGENKNDENVLVIENTNLATAYRDYFRNLWNAIPDEWLNANPRAESEESIGSCTDGVDNDFDGLIDSDDDSCKSYSKQPLAELGT